MSSKIIHIGFPKAASTYLQEAYFPSLNQLKFHNNQETKDLFYHLTHDDETIFDHTSIQSKIDKWSRGAELSLFSHEALSGIHGKTGFVNRSQIARRLQNLGFDKVIVVIRNQTDAVESVYKEYVKNGGTLPYRKYFNHLDGASRYHFHMDYFRYFPMLKLYFDLFGEPNVLVLQYEALHASESIEKLSGFLGVDINPAIPDRRVNKSPSHLGTGIQRFLNHFVAGIERPQVLLNTGVRAYQIYRFLLPIFGGVEGSEPLLNQEFRDRLSDYYRSDNQRIKTELGIELDGKYPV